MRLKCKRLQMTELAGHYLHQREHELSQMLEVLISTITKNSKELKTRLTNMDHDLRASLTTMDQKMDPNRVKVDHDCEGEGEEVN